MRSVVPTETGENPLLRRRRHFFHHLGIVGLPDISFPVRVMVQDGASVVGQGEARAFRQFGHRKPMAVAAEVNSHPDDPFEPPTSVPDRIGEVKRGALQGHPHHPFAGGEIHGLENILEILPLFQTDGGKRLGRRYVHPFGVEDEDIPIEGIALQQISEKFIGCKGVQILDIRQSGQGDQELTGGRHPALMFEREPLQYPSEIVLRLLQIVIQGIQCRVDINSRGRKHRQQHKKKKPYPYRFEERSFHWDTPASLSEKDRILRQENAGSARHRERKR